MSAADLELKMPPSLADQVASVRAQLVPIHSRSSLLESYRRESLWRFATALSAGSGAEALELAYALRWRELETEPEPRTGERWSRDGDPGAAEE